MRKEQPLNLSKLILSSILNLFFGFLNSNQKITFPDQIGKYKFIKKINITKRNSKSNKIFSYALYKNSNGQKAFAKMWSGKLKNINYYTLSNETIMYMVLNKLIRRIGKSMPKKFEDIIIPQFVAKLETNNSLTLLTEFIEDAKSLKILPKKQVEIYIKTVDFLRLLGNELSAKEREQISKRDSNTITLLYFPLLLKAILAHPKALFSLLQGVPVFLKSIPLFLKKDEIILSHRDLHLENILMSKNKIVLMDLQFCLFSNPLYDSLITLRMHWTDKEFRKRLLGKIRNLYGKNKDYDILIRGLMVHSATHSLTESVYTKLITKKFIDYLNCATKPNFRIL